jgi:hypothetical protein
MAVDVWCGAGSNRRHKDFQSFALPTELPHHQTFLELPSCHQQVTKSGCKNRGYSEKTEKSSKRIPVCIVYFTKKTSRAIGMLLAYSLFMPLLQSLYIWFVQMINLYYFHRHLFPGCGCINVQLKDQLFDLWLRFCNRLFCTLFRAGLLDRF